MERHRNTKKHKLNTERYRMELDHDFKYDKLSVNDTGSKLDIGETCVLDDISIVKTDRLTANDEHLTSISSIVSKNSLLKINETCSVIMSNYNEMDSRTIELADLVKQLKSEHTKTNEKQNKTIEELTNKITILTKDINKNKKTVSFSSINENDNKLELFKLLVNQGELLNNSNELDDIATDLKISCKELLIKLSSNIMSNDNMTIYKLLINQYDILNKELNDPNSRDKLKEIHHQIFKLCGNQL
jgi:hypothetical protein